MRITSRVRVVPLGPEPRVASMLPRIPRCTTTRSYRNIGYSIGTVAGDSSPLGRSRLMTTATVARMSPLLGARQARRTWRTPGQGLRSRAAILPFPDAGRTLDSCTRVAQRAASLPRRGSGPTVPLTTSDVHEPLRCRLATSLRPPGSVTCAAGEAPGSYAGLCTALQCDPHIALNAHYKGELRW